MKIDLTKEQAEAVALDWIKQQQNIPKGYVKVIATLFAGATFAKWSWMDALSHAAKICSKNYCSDMNWIKQHLGNTKNS